MHRKSQLQTSGPILLLLVLVFLGLQLVLKNPYVAGTSFEYSRGCDQLTCRIGEQCVNRKFWCTRPPCPNMTYCSKSRKELLKGPETCESVVCSLGYKCFVRVRDCKWNKKCKQQIARCITEREYEEGPASCADTVCPTGHRCVLRETHCYRPPCKLTKSCARDRDVVRWFDKCKKLACQSEHSCFLRRPPSKCTMPPCDHVPDCLEAVQLDDNTNTDSHLPYKQHLDERCRGWICPVNEECVVVRTNFNSNCEVGKTNEENDCPVVRSCRESILLPPTAVLDDSATRDFSQMSSGEIFNDMKTRDWLSLKNPASTTTSVTTTSTTTTKASSGTSFGDSAWLTYLRRKAGDEAVQYWIEKARTDADYESFLDWLNQVAHLLGPETYRLWLSEVELANINVPEFQSWLTSARANNHQSTILPLTRRRLTANDRTRRPASNHRTSFPTFSSNVYYDDKNFDPIAIDSNPRPAYQQAPATFMEKQEVHPTGSKLENPNNQQEPQQQQQQHSNPTNFNFNRASRFNGTAVLLNMQNTSFPYFNGQQQQQKQWLAGDSLPHRAPSFEAQEFSDSVKNSWKSWQSYYQLKSPVAIPPVLSLPSPQNPNGMQTASQERDSYYLSNYTKVRQNYSFAAQSSPEVIVTPQIRQTQVFFPSDEFKGKEEEKSQWYQGSQVTIKSETPTTTTTTTPKTFYGKPTTGKEEESAAAVGSLFDSISDLQQFHQAKPNILKLTPNQLIQMLSSHNISLDNEQPNVLIYFPPPFNFLIYYSNEKTNNSLDKTEANNNSFSLMPNNNEDKTKPRSEEKVIPSNDQATDNKVGKFDKQKRREYIRKLLKELLEYWDEEEKSEEGGDNVASLSNVSENKSIAASREENNSRSINNNDKNRIETNENKINAQTSRSSLVASNLPVDDDTPLAEFLEWLTQNTSLLDLKSRRKGAPSFNDTDGDDQSPSNDYNNSINLPTNSNFLSPRKVRVLVDIDKNPELMKMLFSRNSSESKLKNDEYQVIVNLEDYVDPQEEELISRKLVDIVKYQLHRNLTRSEKMPKSLWVFPVYDGGDNETLFHDKVKDDKVLTLHDVDFPTDAHSNGDLKSDEKDIDGIVSDYDWNEKSYGESKIYQVTSRYKLRNYGG